MVSSNRKGRILATSGSFGEKTHERFAERKEKLNMSCLERSPCVNVVENINVTRKSQVVLRLCGSYNPQFTVVS